MQHFWLEDNRNQLSIIARRIGAITRLKIEHSEKFKTFRFGVRSRLKLHHDSYSDDGNDHNIWATWLNYLTDVEAGGSTYFPQLNINVKPEKSSALFWYNFKKSGELDLETLHSGCPVVFGTKWIAVKFVKDKGQEFTNPCSLTENDHNFLQILD